MNVNTLTQQKSLIYEVKSCYASCVCDAILFVQYSSRRTVVHIGLFTLVFITTFFFIVSIFNLISYLLV